MMAQLVGYGGEEGVECVVYNASYGVTQQLLQPPQQTGHETGETDTAEHEPCYEEIDTATAADRETAVVRKLSARDLQYERIQETMYAAAVSQPEEDSPKMKEKCGDWCCSSVICIDKIDYKTPVFRRARAMGWRIYAHTLFPLMGNKLRKFLVYSQLIIFLMTFIFSIIIFSKGRNAVFDVVFLVVALIGSLLAATDATFNLLTSCHIFENHHKYTNTAVNTVDVLRIIASEIVLYVLLMCSIYKFQTLLDTVSLVLLLISAISSVIYVYIVRIVIILRAIAHNQRMRKPPQNRDTSSVQFDHSISRSAKVLQGYFVYHTIMQMLLQVVMVLAIAVRIWFEKEHIIQSGHANDDIHVHVLSGPLWFMMVGGYVLPYCGFLTFFIVTFQWVQEFPIGLCIDMITVLQLSEADPAATSQATCNTANSWKMEKIRTYFKIDELKEKFGTIRNSSFGKLLYPFLSPTMVILCIVFTGLHTAFALSIPGEDLLFFRSERVIFACFSTIANTFTFTVAIVWIIIITAIVSLLPVLLAVAVVAYAVYVGVVIIGVYL